MNRPSLLLERIVNMTTGLNVKVVLNSTPVIQLEGNIISEHEDEFLLHGVNGNDYLIYWDSVLFFEYLKNSDTGAPSPIAKLILP